MKWTPDHDEIFLREIIVHTPWTHKRGSPEKGIAWAKIAESLNALECIPYRVTQRSVRNRYILLGKKHK